jgi:hypothetical protein
LADGKFFGTLPFLDMFTRNRGKFMILSSSGGDRRVAVNCLKLTTSKSRLTSPSEISSAGVLCGKWSITAFMGFSDFGKQE